MTTRSGRVYNAVLAHEGEITNLRDPHSQLIDGVRTQVYNALLAVGQVALARLVQEGKKTIGAVVSQLAAPIRESILNTVQKQVDHFVASSGGENTGEGPTAASAPPVPEAHQPATAPEPGVRVPTMEELTNRRRPTPVDTPGATPSSAPISKS